MGGVGGGEAVKGTVEGTEVGHVGVLRGHTLKLHCIEGRVRWEGREMVAWHRCPMHLQRRSHLTMFILIFRFMFNILYSYLEI